MPPSTPLETLLDQKASELLAFATEHYENDPRDGVRQTPFLFVRSESGIDVVPVKIQIDPVTLAMAGSRGRSPLTLERAILSSVRERAGQVGPELLVGVGYLFAASGDFPGSDLEMASVGLLRARGVTETPWAREGVVLLVDTPDRRMSWACLRQPGAVADPLSDPAQVRVEAGHIQRLYPHRDPPGFWE